MRMSQVKDPAIKLFGKTITLSPIEVAFDHRHHQQLSCSSSQDNKNNSGGEVRQEDDLINLSDEESLEPSSQSEGCDTPKTPNADRETSSPKETTKEEQSETNASQEKTLKKPDKILPCPRCNSMETKFCYYNNYNVNQPRHFCKKCQRYWTAGGTMRNVPVGSGRRKNKNSCGLNYRHIIVSEALQAAQADGANGIRLSSLKADGSVFAFGSERPLCESMASALDLAGNDHSNGFGGFSSARPELIEKGGTAGTQDSVLTNFQGFTPQVPCFPGAPWPSQWNSAHWSPPTTPHPFNPSGFPMTFYPASPYWSCAVPSPWNVPWLSPPPSCPSPTSPTLGKHYRDESMLNPSNMKKLETIEKDAEGSVQLQKTFRIDDSNEAANSSICSSLGITSNNKESLSAASLFKAFLPRVDERNQVVDTSRVLQANPAAFSRSMNFQESM